MDKTAKDVTAGEIRELIVAIKDRNCQIAESENYLVQEVSG